MSERDRFVYKGSSYAELIDAAAAAEMSHAADGIQCRVRALVDCEHGLFKAGDVVYTSKGAPE